MQDAMLSNMDSPNAPSSLSESEIVGSQATAGK